MAKYGGYYPTGVEEMAEQRDALRREGRFVEADILRDEIRGRFGVDVSDGPRGYVLNWHAKSEPCDICKR